MNQDEEFQILPFDKQMQLTPQEFISYNRRLQAFARASQREVSPGYSEYSQQEKVQFWVGCLGRQMRWQAESGLDPYAGYSVEWRQDLLRLEPALDSLIEQAFKGSLGWEWSYQEYQNRVEFASEQPLTLPSQVQDFANRLAERATRQSTISPPVSRKSFWHRLFGGQ